MRKFNLAGILLLFVSLLPMKADEGMWLLPLLEKMNGKQMANMGFELTPQDIYNINNSSVKDAIVMFGGFCTGEIVSRNGLIFTNHHCGYGAIQKLSSVEHDYLKDGYWAMNNSEELPAEGLYVSFLESFNDITDEYNAILDKMATIKNQKKADKYYQKAIKKFEDRYIKGDKHLNYDILPFYGGNKYYFIVYKTFKDIRFVGAPPSSIGKFGADTDNWMWPRHTGDFSVFRVYADKDNNPAEYSKDNVPYTPKRFLKISLKGIEPGDPTMIMGYPGTTNRFMTHSEVIEARDLTNAIRIKVRTVRQEKMMEDMEADPKIRIQYSNKYALSSNGWKKWIGMAQTFKKLGVPERRAEEEARFTEWVNQDPERIARYGQALEKVNSAIAERKEALGQLTYLNESLKNIELAQAAAMIKNGIDKYKGLKKDSEKEAFMADFKKSLSEFYKDYSPATDRKITVAMMEIFRENIPAEKLPSFYSAIQEESNAEDNACSDICAYVDAMFDQAPFVTEEGALEIFEEGIKAENNPMNDMIAYQVYNSAEESAKVLRKAVASVDDKFKEGKKEYIAGTLEMREGEAIYPDANFTMRLTYGTVKGYSPRDAVEYRYYTTLDGVMEKEDPDNWEFVVPAKLKELWAAQDFGDYALPSGKMPLAFLSNNDITGGNSGSPIMNGRGELIGLAFDGNWESMSSDIIFEPELQRCINVDARYVLFIIDKFGGAGWLLDEMEIVK